MVNFKHKRHKDGDKRTVRKFFLWGDYPYWPRGIKPPHREWNTHRKTKILGFGWIRQRWSGRNHCWVTTRWATKREIARARR